MLKEISIKFGIVLSKKNGICVMANTFGQIDALYNVFKDVNISHIDIDITNRNINNVRGVVESNKDKKIDVIYFGKLTEKEKDEYVKYCKI